MKRIVSILMMMVAMMTITAGAFAQTPNQKQRIRANSWLKSRRCILRTTWLSMRRPQLVLSKPILRVRRKSGRWVLVFAAIRKVLRHRVNRI